MSDSIAPCKHFNLCCSAIARQVAKKIAPCIHTFTFFYFLLIIHLPIGASNSKTRVLHVICFSHKLTYHAVILSDKLQNPLFHNGECNIEQISYECEKSWHIAQHRGNLLDQSCSAQALLIQSEC
jgi:hypothetical protein